MPVAGKKVIYGGLGLLFTGLGILGAWLPGLPTTVFILLAMWAFSNSSQRLHRWLTHIPILRTAVTEANRFQREGTVTRHAKYISQACSWLSFIGVTIAFQSLLLSLIVGLLAASCSVFMYITPTANSEKIPEKTL